MSSALVSRTYLVVVKDGSLCWYPQKKSKRGRGVLQVHVGQMANDFIFAKKMKKRGKKYKYGKNGITKHKKWKITEI